MQYFLADIQNNLSDFMTEISLQIEETQLAGLRSSLMPYTQQMREFQKDYIEQITSSSGSLENFHTRYCAQREINPYVNGANLEMVCHTIDNSKLLTVNKAS
ncbi:hypothetical protein [Aliiglaciecola sp. LCG003]|uniref:hypothetical protein n=1 Tax=Aliiglaciecola sp. LCG003 TaxID=3053655 RepID=UPI0025732D46|nr:hypothetical protein [Aliiglaciecola sp. LCG003]WJG08793.1 hypothetical protein QR722_15830 [Aliiglaciecola sp. LCG003]